MLAVALERSTSTIPLVREDLIDRHELTVYVGGEDGVTLRIPVPDGTIDAGALEVDDPALVDFAVDVVTHDGRTTTLPLQVPHRAKSAGRFFLDL